MDGMLTIGRLAAEAQLSADTIRYYESVGLVPAPARSPAGYRLYPHTEVRRLQLIKQGKLLGLSLPAIKEFVEQTFTDSCVHLQQTLLEHIPAQLTEIEARIATLESLKHDLLALQEHLIRLNGTLRSDPVVECEHCPCVAGGEGREAIAGKKRQPVAVIKPQTVDEKKQPRGTCGCGCGCN